MNHFHNIDFNRISEGELLDFLEGRHHNYALDMLLLLQKNLQAAVTMQPFKAFFLENILGKVKHLHFLTYTLISLKQNSLFPFIRRLCSECNKAKPERFLMVPLAKSCIRLLDEQQNAIMEELEEVRVLVAEYSQNNSMNEITRLCFAELEEFERDFSSGLDREKEFLFPRLLELEEKVRLISMQSSAISPGPGKDA